MAVSSVEMKGTSDYDKKGKTLALSGLTHGVRVDRLVASRQPSTVATDVSHAAADGRTRAARKVRGMAPISATILG
jgi:hypothetical protein